LIIKRTQGPASFALLDHWAFQRSQQFFHAGNELQEFDLHHVSILQLVSVTQPNVGSDFNDIPRVMSCALFVLIRA
jgi:hypothetical protein